MRVLVAGAKGKLGGRLVEELRTTHRVTGVDLPELDITDFGAVQAAFDDTRPELVINSAAWTDVDGCAREPDKALAINGYGAQNLALAAHKRGAAILQVSSNEVFPGTASQPYLEYDATAPINPYAYSKWIGERSVAEINPRHYIVRTSWLFAHGGRNFLHAIIDRARDEKPLRIVVDEVANPTYNDDLAQAIAQLIATKRYGTYHLVNEGVVSRYTFGRYALDRAGFSETPIAKISRHEWPRPSTPPCYSGLRNFAAAQMGITLRDWREAVDAFLEKEGLLRAMPADS